MLRDGPSHHIKNLLLHPVPALNGTAVRTIPIRLVNEVFALLRVNCHDFFRRINRNSRKVLPRPRGSRPSRELPRGAASGVSKQVILGLTAGSIMRKPDAGNPTLRTRRKDKKKAIVATVATMGFVRTVRKLRLLERRKVGVFYHGRRGMSKRLSNGL